MDITGMNNQAPMEWPSDELQMARIKAGALGNTINEQSQEVPQAQPQVNTQVPSVTTEELNRLQAVDNMVKSGELTSSYGQNDTQVQQPTQETQATTQDQSGSTDWMAQFDDAFGQNDTQNTQPQASTQQANDVDQGVAQPQQERYSESEVALINEGAKIGVSGDSMIDFARSLTTSDYMELYKYKQSQQQSAPTQQPPADDSGQTPGYQPRNFTRTKPTQGPSVANLNGSPTAPATGNGVPRLYGSGAMNYNI